MRAMALMNSTAAPNFGIFRLRSGTSRPTPPTSYCMQRPLRSTSARRLLPIEITNAFTEASPAVIRHSMPARRSDSSHSTELTADEQATSMTSSGRPAGNQGCATALRSSSR